jgi:reverse gyrase
MARLSPLPKKQWAKHFKTGLKSAYRELLAGFKKRTEANFESEKIKDFFSLLMEKDKNAAAVKGEVQGIFDEFKKAQDSQFIDNPYQTAITAQMFGSTTNSVASQIPTGEGKSFIMVALANLHTAKGHSVTIIVPTLMLF